MMPSSNPTQAMRVGSRWKSTPAFRLLMHKKNMTRSWDASLFNDREIPCTPAALINSSVTLRLVTAYVCAVSRLMGSPMQSGRTEREVLGAPNRPDIERWRGKEPVMESGGQQKTCVLRCRKLRMLWPELDCSKSN